ncbi:MAG: hypothetical protein MZU95_01255 [Desulfomicrobium escambiense]|nr:hypothetical protein [Desulfomicrobium escambiense]
MRELPTRRAPAGRSRCSSCSERKDAAGRRGGRASRRQLDRTASDFRRERPAGGAQGAGGGRRDPRQPADATRSGIRGASCRARRPTRPPTFEEQIGADIAARRGEAARGRRRRAPRPSATRARRRWRGRAGWRAASSRWSQRLREQQQQRGERSRAARGAAGPAATSGAAGRRQAARRGGDQAPAAIGRAAARAGRPADQRRRTTARDGGSIAAFDPRQFQREARERRTEAAGAAPRTAGARRRREATSTPLINNMRALDSARVYTDFDEAARPADAARRGDSGASSSTCAANWARPDAEQLLLGGSDDGPRAAYRKLDRGLLPRARAGEEEVG